MVKNLPEMQQTQETVANFVSFLLSLKVKLLRHVPLFVTPRAIQSMEFSWPEYWGG